MSLSDYLIAFSFVWLTVITYLYIRLLSHYNRLTGDSSKKDLLTSLNRLLSSAKDNSEDIKNLSEKLKTEIEANKNHLQKIGFLRYNPFTDTGGDQSFSVSLLDEKGDGLVISSLHSRENTRLYAKKVVGGKVQAQATSTEEQTVIKDALK